MCMKSFSELCPLTVCNTVVSHFGVKSIAYSSNIPSLY